jgi:hypothetical protein
MFELLYKATGNVVGTSPGVHYPTGMNTGISNRTLKCGGFVDGFSQVISKKDIDLNSSTITFLQNVNPKFHSLLFF